MNNKKDFKVYKNVKNPLDFPEIQEDEDGTKWQRFAIKNVDGKIWIGYVRLKPDLDKGWLDAMKEHQNWMEKKGEGYLYDG